MQKELVAWEANETWKITYLTLQKKAIGSKWHYKIKFKPNVTIDKYKAHYVVRGFTQVKNKDYKHTFLPVAKWPTARVSQIKAQNEQPNQQQQQKTQKKEDNTKANWTTSECEKYNLSREYGR